MVTDLMLFTSWLSWFNVDTDGYLDTSVTSPFDSMPSILQPDVEMEEVSKVAPITGTFEANSLTRMYPIPPSTRSPRPPVNESEECTQRSEQTETSLEEMVAEPFYFKSCQNAVGSFQRCARVWHHYLSTIIPHPLICTATT